jgi:hypothetical protein
MNKQQSTNLAKKKNTAVHKAHTGRCFTARLILTQLIHMHQKVTNKQEGSNKHSYQ